jgi:hypothetical protein
VVEEQVDEQFTVAHAERDLATDEGESMPELGDQMGQVSDEGVFELAFAEAGVEAEKVQPDRVVDELADGVGVGGRQGGGEIVGCGPGAELELGADVMYQGVTGPAEG